MIDTHAHLDGEAFDTDRNEIIRKAFDSGLEYIIIPAIEPGNFQNVLDLAKSNQYIFCGLGVHPHHANDYNDEIRKYILTAAASENKVRAIGEIGLDYYYDFAPREIQQIVFRDQLKLAKELNLPAIIHNRESDEDLLNILEEEQDGNLNAVLHCFSGGTETLEKALNLGFNVSFTGNITFKKSDLNEIVEKAPLEKIFLETDCPYMTPVPYRGKRNDPSMVKLVAEKIAEIKSLSIDEVIKMTSSNAKKFFRLLLVIFMFSLAVVNSFSQENAEEKADSNDAYHPFEKFIGINPIVGVNTIVQTIKFLDKGGEKPISYEGLPAFGGGLTYGLLDFLLLKADYVYSINTEEKKQIFTDSANFAGDDIHQYFELRSIWLANPYSTVNFFGSIGATYINSVYNKGAIEEKVNKRNTWALSASVGLNINISLKSYGLLNFMAEWMLHFDMNKRVVPNYIVGLKPGTNEFETRPVEESTFYSMPRLSLIYYPPFKKK